MSLDYVRLGVLALATLASALIAGFFYAYHCSVMPGLAASEPVAAIRAMQSINAVVRNSVVAFSFFGTLVFGVAAAVLSLPTRSTWSRALVWAGVVVYGLGALVVTFVYNVPLNERLAAVSPTPASASELWRDYADPWVRWNVVRMIASIAAFIAFTAALATTDRTSPATTGSLQ